VRAPDFVDHHVHLVRVSASGAVGIGGRTRESISEFHRRVAAAGSTPMDTLADEPVAADLAGALHEGLTRAASLGLIGVTEAGMTDWRHWDGLVALRAAGGGRLPVDVRILVASGIADLDRMAAAAPEGDDRLALIGVKFYADGWLGPRTCACSVPFADGPDDGVLFQDASTLARRAEPYAARGWRIATHAIGDRAIEAVLDAYESVFGGTAGCRAAAPRVEHAQVLRPDLVARMADLGVVACIQPCFAASDADAAAAALAGRFPLAYRWDLLLEAGVRVVAGSDFPIETLDPTIGLRHLTDGAHPLAADVALALMTTPLEAPVRPS